METEEKITRKRKSKRHKISFLRHFSFEIIIAFLFLFGVFLLFEEMEIKTFVFRGILSFFQTFSHGFSDFLGAILGGLSVIETSDVVGTLFIIIAFILLIWRARQKAILRYSDLTVCPECRGELMHVHRNTLQRLTSTVLRLKIRRFKCKECTFDGIRIRSLHSR